MRDHRLSRGVERGLWCRRVRLANTVNADTIRCRRLSRLELRTELARDHATALIDFHDPSASKEIQILVDGPFRYRWAQAELPGVGVARERLAHEAEILAQRITLDEELAISLSALGAAEYGEDGVVWAAVSGEPDAFHGPGPVPNKNRRYRLTVTGERGPQGRWSGGVSLATEPVSFLAEVVQRHLGHRATDRRTESRDLVRGAARDFSGRFVGVVDRFLGGNSGLGAVEHRDVM